MLASNDNSMQRKSCSVGFYKHWGKIDLGKQEVNLPS